MSTNQLYTESGSPWAVNHVNIWCLNKRGSTDLRYPCLLSIVLNYLLYPPRAIPLPASAVPSASYTASGVYSQTSTYCHCARLDGIEESRQMNRETECICRYPL